MEKDKLEEIVNESAYVDGYYLVKGDDFVWMIETIDKFERENKMK